jgi:hypothetical protein
MLDANFHTAIRASPVSHVLGAVRRTRKQCAATCDVFRERD